MTTVPNPTPDEALNAKIDQLIEQRLAQKQADNQVAQQHPLVGLLVGLWDYLVARLGPMAATAVLCLVGLHYTVMAVLERPEVQAAIAASTARDAALKDASDAQAEKTRLEIQKLQGP